MMGFLWNVLLPLSGESDSYASGPVSATVQMFDWDQLFVAPIRNFFIGLMNYLPDFLTALCILLVGWVVGRILQFIVSAFLNSIGFDHFAQKIGISGLLEESEKKAAPHRWFGLLVFWLVMFVSLIMSLEQLRLRIASNQLDRFMHFVLSLFTVFIIFILGMFLSFIASKIVRATAVQIKMAQPNLYADLTRWIVLIFTILVCLIQMGMPAEILLIVVGGIFATLCITFIIAFGIGGRAWAGKVLDVLLKGR